MKYQEIPEGWEWYTNALDPRIVREVDSIPELEEIKKQRQRDVKTGRVKVGPPNDTRPSDTVLGGTTRIQLQADVVGLYRQKRGTP